MLVLSRCRCYPAEMNLKLQMNFTCVVFVTLLDSCVIKYVTVCRYVLNNGIQWSLVMVIKFDVVIMIKSILLRMAAAKSQITVSNFRPQHRMLLDFVLMSYDVIHNMFAV